MYHWQYGQVKNKHVCIRHTLSTLVNDSIQQKINSGLVARGGNGNSVNSTGSSMNQSAGASFRVLIDCADWDLMRAKYWGNTDEEPDRRERRMAECLVHGRVPWDAFTEVVARTETCAASARDTLASLGKSTPVAVRPSWYF